jgi:hypothetical protein
MIRLELWSPHELALAQVPPQAEHEPHVVIAGTCFGHPLKEDGAEVTTGKITLVRAVDDEIIATTTAGAEYELGEPSGRYKTIFPNTRQAILNWLKANPQPTPA